MRYLSTSRRRSVAAISLAIGLVLGASTAVVATSVVRSGHAVTAVKVATENDYHSDGGDGYTDIPGMSVTATVPANTKALFLVTFSADSECSQLSSCDVQLLMNGNVLYLENFATTGLTTNSMQWVTAPLGPGTYTFKMQEAAAVGQYITFYNRTLSVLRSKV